MNPAQFQNGGGMGRPMQNGMQHLNQQMGQQPQPPPQITSQNAGAFIVQTLRNQGPFSGWQAQVPREQRVAQVKLLVDSLRLIRPTVEYTQAVNVALAFEQRAFGDSDSREKYIAACSEKLTRIRDQRAQQVNQAGQGMNAQFGGQDAQPMQQIGQMGQNMMFQQPTSQQGQQGSVPNPQGIPQGMFNNGPGMPSGMPNQQGINQQTPQQRANNANQMRLSDEENKIVNAMASHLAKTSTLTPAQRQNIISSFSPQQQDSIRSQGLDPLLLYFRSQASRNFRNQKMSQMQGNTEGNNSQLQAQMANNNMMGLQANAAFGLNAPNMNNLHRFQGQQAEGMRSQETGELVVPANSGQGMTPEQFRMQQAMMQNRMAQGGGQAGMNPQLLRQQQLAHIQAGQQNANDQMQTLAQFQNQTQTLARNQAAAAARAQIGIQGQAGIQGVPPTGTPVQMLSHPASQNMQGTSPQVAARPPSRTPMPGQQPTASQQMTGQQAVDPQSREALLAKYPPGLANVLRQKPQSEWRGIIAQFMHHNNMRRNMSHQPPGSQQTPQSGQVNQLANGQFTGAPTVSAAPMQTSLSAGAPANQGQDSNQMSAAQHLQQQQHQRQLQQNQEMMMQQRQLQQQQQQQRLQAGQQPQPAAGPQNPQQSLMAMSQDQMNAMDRQPFPQNITSLFQRAPNFPHGQLRLWGQLKQWLAQNPQPNIPDSIIISFQQRQFTMAMQARQAQTNAAARQPGANQPPQQAAANAMAQAQIQQNNAAQINQAGVPNNRPFFKPIDDSDLQRARQTDARLNQMPDAQLKQFLTSQRQDQYRKKLLQQQQIANGEAQHLAGQTQQVSFMPIQTGQIQTQNQQQMARQLSGQGLGPNAMPAQGQAPQMPQMPTGVPRPQPGKGQASQQGQPPVAAPNKGVKRANDDDVVEVPPPAQVPPPQQRAVPQITKEQFERMTPQQKEQFQTMKRQQAQRLSMQRIYELTKQVQATFTPLRPIKTMDANSRDRIRKLLTTADTTNMLSKFEQFILAYMNMGQKDDEIKKLLHQRLLLVPQYIPSSYSQKTFEPVKDFSVNADKVESTIKDMLAKFHLVLKRSAEQSKQQQQAQIQQLTPENLTLLQAQEAQRKAKDQKSKSNNAPPAPTSSEPPFQIGDPRGHGTPRYAQEGIKQEDLKLPTGPKRQKRNPPTTIPTPVSTQGQSTLQTKSPKAIKDQIVQNTFRCTVPDCDHNLKGFATEKELKQHAASTHKPVMEHITNPIAFLEEMTMKALDLDVNGQPNKKPEPAMKAPPMQKTLSKVTTASIKQEKDSKPSTPAAMSRGLSQTSPAATSRTIKTEQVETDPWATSNVPLNTLRDTFGAIDMGDVVPSIGRGVGDGEGIGLDLEAMMEEYTQSDAWTKIQAPAMNASVDDESDREKSKSLSPPIANGDISPELRRESKNEVLVDLAGLDGIDLGLGLSGGDMRMGESWELPELGGFESSSGSGGMERKDSETDSWDEWLNKDWDTLNDVKMMGSNGEGLKIELDNSEGGIGSEFVEIDWDNLLKDGNGADWDVLQAGAGPITRGPRVSTGRK